jgi:tetratricopeptide (TPR) repeat protein
VLFEARGDTGKAAEAFEAELKAHPNVYQAHFNLGKILSRIGRAKDAARHFRAAVEANQSFGAGYLYLAKALLDAGELDESEAAALKGLESDAAADVRPLGHYVLADVYTRRGREREAARHVAIAQRLERGGK